MKKLIFALIGLIIAVSASSQTKWEKQIYEGGVAYSVKVTGLDTTTANTTKYTEWLDWSLINGQATVWYVVKVTGDDIDSVLIDIEGRTVAGAIEVIKTGVASSIQTAGDNAYIDTFTTHVGTAIDRYPEVRLKLVGTDITSSVSNGRVLFTIFTRDMDALPERSLWK